MTNPASRQSEHQACPVCQGRGVVAAGFYNTSPVFGATGTADEQCRTCEGARIITRPSEVLEAAEQVAFATRSYDEASEPQKSAYRAEVIEAARELALALEGRHDG